MSAQQFPVVHVVLKETVSRFEEEALEDFFVLHDVESIEHIEAFLFCQNQGGIEHGLQVVLAWNDIVAVAGSQLLMVFALENGGWKVIEARQSHDVSSISHDVA